MHLDVKEALTHKIGPLPGGVWAGIAVLGIVAYVHFHKKGSPSSTAATTTDPGTGALDTAGGLLGAGGGGGGGDTGAGVVGSSSDGGAPAGSFPDPTPVFVPIPDPSATQFPDSGSTTPTTSSTPTASSTTDTTTPSDLLPALAPTQTLNVSSQGDVIGTVQAPIFAPGTPASDIYAAVGLKPSDPYTLTPPSEPQNATQLIEQAQGVADRQAIQTSIKTGTPVAV